MQISETIFWIFAFNSPIIEESYRLLTGTDQGGRGQRVLASPPNSKRHIPIIYYIEYKTNRYPLMSMSLLQKIFMDPPLLFNAEVPNLF